LSAQGEKPTIQLVNGEHVLSLPDPMRSILQSYDSTFVIWRQSEYLPTLVKDYAFFEFQSPSAVIGDFNGDGILDVALQGHDKTTDLLLCVLSRGAGYEVQEIQKGPTLTDSKSEWYGMGDHKEYGQWVYLTFQPKGKVNSPFENQTLDLKTDAFEVEYFEKASVLYYWENGKFNSFTTGD